MIHTNRGKQGLVDIFGFTKDPLTFFIMGQEEYKYRNLS